MRNKSFQRWMLTVYLKYMLIGPPLGNTADTTVLTTTNVLEVFDKLMEKNDRS
ncbi:hypothetical protein [Clostridioides difficile]|uniref:hypothetical protein n=1 Tax=Clostridioides difficile TaxID=1496 RepID=UPI001F187A1B|nr:hypothetical protein [Clostridioides difficile]